MIEKCQGTRVLSAKWAHPKSARPAKTLNASQAKRLGCPTSITRNSVLSERKIDSAYIQLQDHDRSTFRSRLLPVILSGANIIVWYCPTTQDLHIIVFSCVSLYLSPMDNAQDFKRAAADTGLRIIQENMSLKPSGHGASPNLRAESIVRFLVHQDAPARRRTHRFQTLTEGSLVGLLCGFHRPYTWCY